MLLYYIYIYDTDVPNKPYYTTTALSIQLQSSLIYKPCPCLCQMKTCLTFKTIISAASIHRGALQHVHRFTSVYAGGNWCWAGYP